MTNYDFGGIPASDADRDRARSMLQSALSQGQLGQDEFNRRHNAIYSAQTYGQLGSLTADLTGGGPASQTGGQGFQQASGFGGAAPASGLGTQGPLGFQSGADLGHAANPGPGNPIGQQPGAGSPFQNALNQGGNQPNLGAQGLGGQNQFGGQQGFGAGPNFGAGPDFGNQGLGNQGFGNQGFSNQGFGNQYGYQNPNQPGDIIGNMINNAKVQGLGGLVNSGLLGGAVDRSSRRRRGLTVGRIIRLGITFIGIAIALYFAFHHGVHFENCNGDCGDGG
ncbi:MAG TPA: DUF1707 domain-containing protein [Streptosporangiaceae bacterium]